MNKLYNRIIWENGTTPALNEDNLNAMSKGIDDIDDRVIDLGGAVLDVLPDLEDMLSHAAELKEYRDDAVAAAASAEDDEEDAEAYAVGTRGGVPVTSGDPAFHNNAYWYSQQTNPTSFANMSDVDFDNLQNGQVPEWNSTTQKWENASVGGSSASSVAYSNSASGMTATNVQDAIDEIYKPTFTEAVTRSNIATGESIPTLFGKIKKFFTDLKGGAFIDTVMSSAVAVAAAATSATITDAAITATSVVEPFIDDGTGDAIAYTNVTVTTGQAVVTFAALANAASIKVRITN